MKLSAEDQLAVLIRARAHLTRKRGWKGWKFNTPSSTTRDTIYGRPLTLGEACQQAAFELDLVPTKRDNTYTVALATGLLRHIDSYGHKSLAGFNDAPETHKSQMVSLIDRRIVELM